MNILTKSEEKLLKEAIDDAEVWEGTLIGNPAPDPLDDFRFAIACMRGALTEVKRQQKELRKLRKAARKYGESQVFCYVATDSGFVDVGSFDLF